MFLENINMVFVTFRLLCFQNTPKIVNRSSINIFLSRRKLDENRKISKFSNQSGYKIHGFPDLLSKVGSGHTSPVSDFKTD